MVVAIIGIMTGVGLVSLVPARTATKLDAAGREVASAIKLAQSYALQGKVMGGVVPCGYGIHTMNDGIGYEIFYIASSTSCYSFNQGPVNYSTSKQLESYNLKEGVQFSANSRNQRIYFTVPHGVIFGNNGSIFTGLNIELNFSNKKKYINVSSGGTAGESVVQ